MAQAELDELASDIRERFNQIPDSAFYGHLEVITARERITELKGKYDASDFNALSMGTKLARILARQAKARAEAQELASLRPREIADFLLRDESGYMDDGSAARLSYLEQCIRDIDLAKPVIERQINQINDATRRIAIQLDGAKEHMRGLLDRLRLAEAQNPNT